MEVFAAPDTRARRALERIVKGGTSVRSIARLLGVSHVGVGAWLQRENRPSIPARGRIETMLKISSLWWFTRKELRELGIGKESKP